MEPGWGGWGQSVLSNGVGLGKAYGKDGEGVGGKLRGSDRRTVNNLSFSKACREFYRQN